MLSLRLCFPSGKSLQNGPKEYQKKFNEKKNNSSEVVQIPTQTWTFNHNHRIIQNKKKQVNLKAPRLQDACSSDSLAWRLKFSFRRTMASLPSPKTSRSSELFSTFKAEFGMLSIQCFLPKNRQVVSTHFSKQKLRQFTGLITYISTQEKTPFF